MPSYPLQEVCLAVIIGTPLLAAGFVALRIFSRRKFATYLGWDDYTIILATVLSIALIYPSVRFVHMWHFGVHIYHVDQRRIEPNYDDFHIILLSFNLLNTMILPLVKASIIILLMRVSSVLPIIRRSLYAVFAFNALACIIPFVILIFQCPPQTGNTWKPRVFGNLHCMNRPRIGQVQVFQTSANLLTDLLVLPIPFLLMRKLERTSIRTRFIIIFLFMTSLGVTAIGAAKIHLTYQDRLYNIQANDWTYNITFCINHAENNVAIIVACIPALRGLIMRWISRPMDEEDARMRRNWPTSPQARDIITFSFSDRSDTTSDRPRWIPILPKVNARVSKSWNDSRLGGMRPLQYTVKTSPASLTSASETALDKEKMVGLMDITHVETFSSLGVLGREKSFSDGEQGMNSTETYTAHRPSVEGEATMPRVKSVDDMEFITVKSGIL
ncbi:hypothetical protein EJ05DRAFT_501914 [Pseudovirgaria hyperparasitica]|uniref:Rhodopsin domain-containing protein n=1 Tax=Pseudovirgaria hyperparasitica TaxID=470096 RepID=A0A6A6W2Q5_9PEZI|nr:uncharacterized protein EJ05DRAFT_501914 [Pseudovirgaria hyperparasitica]KAF2756409.1 hypothetical protein EJ05DRAFT_501914 [Pseudovirgaria hyperparasitica]